MTPLTSANLDALQRLVDTHWWIDDHTIAMEGDLVMQALPALIDAARRAQIAERKLQILYDIGVTDEDNAEMYRRLDAGPMGAGGTEAGRDNTDNG